MNREELQNRLQEIKNKVTAVEQTTDNRIYLPCEAQNAYAVSKFLFQDLACRFVIATCVDSDDCFEVLYHFSYDQLGVVITVKAFIRDRENPAIESITSFLPAAEWIEREMHDIMGIDFRNHPNLRRLILADDWPDGVYPERKQART
ncbi:MAG TPA: NADH-quinone oxidoreductase subunit C [Sedimentisphaerales bacterium]|nr:NADH-quinone oxidoreductase subunit C [Sedimentisphaerales bacterium]